MTVFVALLLALLAFAFIIYPFFKQKVSPIDSGGSEKQRELLSRRDTTYATLKELEFDYQSGMLTEEDYHDLETRYKKKAVDILKNLDNVGKGGGVEDEIEKEVQSRRTVKGEACAQCGAELPAGARFCSQCGAKSDACPQCGAAYEVGARFCAQCGASLGQGDPGD